MFLFAPIQLTFTDVKKLGLYSCTAENILGKVTRQFQLIEGFKPKTPSGLMVGNVGENFIELNVDPGDTTDDLIGYRVEYVTKAVDASTRKTYESFDMINFNTTTGTCIFLSLYIYIYTYYMLSLPAPSTRRPEEVITYKRVR